MCEKEQEEFYHVFKVSTQQHKWYFNESCKRFYHAINVLLGELQEESMSGGEEDTAEQDWTVAHGVLHVIVMFHQRVADCNRNLHDIEHELFELYEDSNIKNYAVVEGIEDARKQVEDIWFYLCQAMQLDSNTFELGDLNTNDMMWLKQNCSSAMSAMSSIRVLVTDSKPVDHEME